MPIRPSPRLVLAGAVVLAACVTERPASPAKTAGGPALTRQEVMRARKRYDVKVLSFDASQRFGTESPYADLVRLRIINHSEVALPHLTVLTKRYDGSGKMVGSSRKPSIAVADLQPGDTAEVDYYPKGHLPGVKRIAVEIEDLIDPEEEQFFPELAR